MSGSVFSYAAWHIAYDRIIKRISEALIAKEVPHTFEMYNGDHRNRLWGEHGRLYTEVLPYFSKLLVAEGN